MKILLGWVTVAIGILTLIGSIVVVWGYFTGNTPLAPSGLLLIYGLVMLFVGRHWIIKARKKQVKVDDGREQGQGLHQAE